MTEISYNRIADKSTHRKPFMVTQQAVNMPDDENDEFRILGFTEREVELILMSVQCIKGSNRFKAGWEVSYASRSPVLEECNPVNNARNSQVGMKDFANLTNTSIAGARAQWRDLISRLMKLPRLPNQSPSPEPRGEAEETIEDCIVVRGETDDESASVVATESDEQQEREAKRKTKTRSKGKQVAKPSVLDSLEAGPDREVDMGATNEAQARSEDDGVAGPSKIEDRTNQAWADIGDGMNEEIWNEMGDKLAL